MCIALLFRLMQHFTVVVYKHHIIIHHEPEKTCHFISDYLLYFLIYFYNICAIRNRNHWSLVGGVTQWQEHRSWLANFPCRTLDLQLMGDHVCG